MDQEVGDETTMDSSKLPNPSSSTERLNLNASSSTGHEKLQEVGGGTALHTQHHDHQDGSPPHTHSGGGLTEDLADMNSEDIQSVSVAHPRANLNPWRDPTPRSIGETNDHSKGDRWGKVCIYKVSATLISALEHDSKGYYSPCIVSIGPFHRRPLMEDHKRRAVQNVLWRTSKDLNVYLDAMKELEECARACYEGDLKQDSGQFVDMMVLDGCFMLECFQGIDETFTKLGYEENDPVFSTRSVTLLSIELDMLMLENQIPLFVLDKLLEIQTDGKTTKGSAAKLARRFFKSRMPTSDSSSMDNIIDNDNEDQDDALHCLDVVRLYILKGHKSDHSSHPQPPASPMPRQHHCLDLSQLHIRPRRENKEPRRPDRQPVLDLSSCVTSLKDAGVRFKVYEANDMLRDVTFENGVIHMPKIYIEDSTKPLLLNLMAFEQYHASIPWKDCKITAYVIFLDRLIDSAHDVRHLHSCGIIQHFRGSDADAARQIDSLSNGVNYPLCESYLASICDQVDRYAQRKRNIWRANLKQKYFSNPWTIISVTAATFVILLTVAQTFYAIYSYYRPTS